MDRFVAANIGKKDIGEIPQVFGFCEHRHGIILVQKQVRKISVITGPDGHGPYSKRNHKEVAKGKWWTVRGYNKHHCTVVTLHIRTGSNQEDTVYSDYNYRTRRSWMRNPERARTLIFDPTFHRPV
ncbi:hypothetical protein C8J56DRAFT_887182 [Mycena floridula]|nr:hypothetical protein C8J56DRAFT_887182 [Mycena floridula]